MELLNLGLVLLLTFPRLGSFQRLPAQGIPGRNPPRSRNTSDGRSRSRSSSPVNIADSFLLRSLRQGDTNAFNQLDELRHSVTSPIQLLLGSRGPQQPRDLLDFWHAMAIAQGLVPNTVAMSPRLSSRVHSQIPAEGRNLPISTPEATTATPAPTPRPRRLLRFRERFSPSNARVPTQSENVRSNTLANFGRGGVLPSDTNRMFPSRRGQLLNPLNSHSRFPINQETLQGRVQRRMLPSLLRGTIQQRESISAEAQRSPVPDSETKTANTTSARTPHTANNVVNSRNNTASNIDLERLESAVRTATGGSFVGNNVDFGNLVPGGLNSLETINRTLSTSDTDTQSTAAPSDMSNATASGLNIPGGTNAINILSNSKATVPQTATISTDVPRSQLIDIKIAADKIVLPVYDFVLQNVSDIVTKHGLIRPEYLQQFVGDATQSLGIRQLPMLPVVTDRFHPRADRVEAKPKDVKVGDGKGVVVRYVGEVTMDRGDDIVMQYIGDILTSNGVSNILIPVNMSANGTAEMHVTTNRAIATVILDEDKQNSMDINGSTPGQGVPAIFAGDSAGGMPAFITPRPTESTPDSGKFPGGNLERGVFIGVAENGSLNLIHDISDFLGFRGVNVHAVDLTAKQIEFPVVLMHLFNNRRGSVGLGRSGHDQSKIDNVSVFQNGIASNQTLMHVFQNGITTKQTPVHVFQNGIATNQSPVPVFQNGITTNQTPVLVFQNGIATNQSPVPVFQNGITTNQTPVPVFQNGITTNPTPLSVLQNRSTTTPIPEVMTPLGPRIDNSGSRTPQDVVSMTDQINMWLGLNVVDQRRAERRKEAGRALEQNNNRDGNPRRNGAGRASEQNNNRGGNQSRSGRQRLQVLHAEFG